MAQRTTLKGHAIPADPPTAEDFSFPPDLYDIMPDPFHNLLDSVATSGSEFALYIRRYQSDTHTPYVIMSALLASFQILNYNVKSLAGGLAFVNPDEREEIGEPRLQRIESAVARIVARVEPYRAALTELERSGSLEASGHEP